VALDPRTTDINFHLNFSDEKLYSSLYLASPLHNVWWQLIRDNILGSAVRARAPSLYHIYATTFLFNMLSALLGQDEDLPSSLAAFKALL
jgi:hypothetical protein